MIKDLIHEALQKSMGNLAIDIVKEVEEMRRKQARAASRDPTKPKRPKNAYQLWCYDTRPSLSGTFKEISKQLSEMWSELPSEIRAKYHEKYQEHKEAYEAAMRVYRSKGQDKSEDLVEGDSE